MYFLLFTNVEFLFSPFCWVKSEPSGTRVFAGGSQKKSRNTSDRGSTNVLHLSAFILRITWGTFLLAELFYVVVKRKWVLREFDFSEGADFCFTGCLLLSCGVVFCLFWGVGLVVCFSWRRHPVFLDFICTLTTWEFVDRPQDVYFKGQNAPLVLDLHGLIQAFRGKEESARGWGRGIYGTLCKEVADQRGYLPAQASSTLAGRERPARAR